MPDLSAVDLVSNAYPAKLLKCHWGSYGEIIPQVLYALPKSK